MPAKIDADSNLRFLYSCFKHSNYSTINYQSVATDFEIKGPAARMRLMRLKLALDNNLAAQHAENAKLKRERDKLDKFGKGGGGGGGGGKGSFRVDDGGNNNGNEDDDDDDEEIFRVKRTGWIGVKMEEEDDVPLLKRKRGVFRGERERVGGEVGVGVGGSRVKVEDLGCEIKMEEGLGYEVKTDQGLGCEVKMEEDLDHMVAVKEEEDLDHVVAVKEEEDEEQEMMDKLGVRVKQEEDFMLNLPSRVRDHQDMMQQSPVTATKHEEPMFDTPMRIKDERMMVDTPTMGRYEDSMSGVVEEQDRTDSLGLPIKMQELVRKDEDQHFIATPEASPVVGIGNDSLDSQTTPLNSETSDWGNIASPQFPCIFDGIKLDNPSL